MEEEDLVNIILPTFEWEGKSLDPPSSMSGLKMIRALVRGFKDGDKSPLEKDFEVIWTCQLGSGEEYKKTIKELKQKGWIGTPRYPKKGRKKGKKVVCLRDREYATHYLKHCLDCGFVDAFLEHHEQYHNIEVER